MSTRNVVIVGGGLGGIRTAQALRRNDFDGSITLIGAEKHLPYDRPPLSKDVLTGRSDPQALPLVAPSELAAQDMRLETGVAATGLDPARRTVTLSDGGRRRYDDLVIATGAVARQPFGSTPRGVFTLRTLEDALDIRAAFDSARRLVVIGAGFIGLEVASSARSLGVEVTVVEAAPKPLTRSLGAGPADAITTLATDAGVRILCNRKVARFVGDHELAAVALDSGELLDADVAVIGVGATPNSDWLTPSGLPIDRGRVVCTTTGRVESHDNVWAVGDVAAWCGADGTPRHLEHWTAAVEQANVVGANIVDGAKRTVTAADYVWSEQFGHKVNLIGDTVHYDLIHLAENAPDRLVALYAVDGRLTGACVVDQMPLVLKCRRWIAAGTSLRAIDLPQSAA